jgi:hypothetical protein
MAYKPEQLQGLLHEFEASPCDVLIGLATSRVVIIEAHLWQAGWNATLLP